MANDINYNNIDSIVDGFNKILKLQSTSAPKIPPQIILLGGSRKPGLSPSKIASAIIQRKSEAGLPVGNLPSGAVSPEELMWRIAIEEIIKAIQNEAIITVAIPPGIAVQVQGSNAGGAMISLGTTIKMATAYAQIQ